MLSIIHLLVPGAAPAPWIGKCDDFQPTSPHLRQVHRSGSAPVSVTAPPAEPTQSSNFSRGSHSPPFLTPNTYLTRWVVLPHLRATGPKATPATCMHPPPLHVAQPCSGHRNLSTSSRGVKAPCRGGDLVNEPFKLNCESVLILNVLTV